VQVPAEETVRDDPVTEHPEAVPFEATNVIAPAVEPPVVVKLKADPYVPDVEVIDNANCGPLPTVTIDVVVSPVT